MKHSVSKLTLAAAVFSLAIAAAPATGFAQAKKMMGKCTEGDRCTASCNSMKWCTVQVCKDGKWQNTMFGCAEMLCSHKKC